MAFTASKVEAFESGFEFMAEPHGVRNEQGVMSDDVVGLKMVDLSS